jgi:hypothetical protein
MLYQYYMGEEDFNLIKKYHNNVIKNGSQIKYLFKRKF